MAETTNQQYDFKVFSTRRIWFSPRHVRHVRCEVIGNNILAEFWHMFKEAPRKVKETNG